MTGLTFVGFIGLLASIKELTPLITQYFLKDPQEIFLDSLVNILNQRNEFLPDNMIFDRDEIKRKINSKAINFKNLPITPDNLFISIKDSLIEILLDNKLLYGVDINEYWAESVVSETITIYNEAIFKNTPFEGVRLGLNELGKDKSTHSNQVEIISLLKTIVLTMEENSELPGLLITPEMIKVNPDAEHKLVLGQRIQIDDVRNQNLMERKLILEEVLNQLEEFVKNKLVSEEKKLNTFWIEGSSGCGKSVLLIQLMQALVIEKDATVIWLDNNSESLLPLLKQWVNKPPIAEETFIFIDDFYEPQDQSKIDFQEYGRLLRDLNNKNIAWPVIVTCGPPEQHHALISDFEQESFNLHEWSLPLVGSGDQEKLKNWYKDLTGKEPKEIGTAFSGSGQGLMVSMVAEMALGKMPEFAKRFCKRLNGLGLLDKMYIPMALNRLYIWTPKEWFDDWSIEDQQALEKLNQKDFQIVSEIGREGDYIRLTHPHLSNEIYQAMRQKEDQLLIVNDLTEAFDRAIVDYPDLAAQMIRKFSEGGDRIENYIDEERLGKSIIDKWKSYLSGESEFPFKELIKIWVNLAIWHSRVESVGENLPEKPLETARNLLNKTPYIWGIFWQLLWNSYPEDLGLRADAQIWINKKGNWKNRSWAFVWGAVFERAEGKEQIALMKQGKEWLEGEGEKLGWSYVWETLIENNKLLISSDLDRILFLGKTWMIGRESQKDWPFVWKKIYDASDTFQNNFEWEKFFRSSLIWLMNHSDHPSWSFIYEQFLDLDYKEKPYLNMGFEWVKNNETLSETPGIITGIINLSKNIQWEEEEVKWSINYLNNHPNQKSWSFLWGALFRHFCNMEMIRIALKWIDSNPKNVRSVNWVLNEIKHSSWSQFSREIVAWINNHEDHPLRKNIKKILGL